MPSLRQGLAAGFFVVLSVAVLVRLDVQYLVTAQDLQPCLRAGAKVLSGEGDLYSDFYFIYPPTMALLFAPFSHLGATAVHYAFGFTELMAVGLACVLTTRLLRVRHWLEWGVASAAVTVLAQVTWDSFGALNVGAYLLPALVALVGLWASGRWEAGCYVLMATALVKPIFAPLVLLPLLAGQGRALLRPALVGAALLSLAATVAPGGWGVLGLPGFVAQGIGMHGDLAIWNISLAGEGKWLHLPGWPVDLLRLAVVAGMAVALVRFRRGVNGPGALLVATVLLLGSFLAGSVSEITYTLFLAPGLVVALPRARGFALALLGTGTAMLVLPHAVFGGVTAHLTAGLFVVVVSELLCFWGLVVVVWADAAHAGAMADPRPAVTGRRASWRTAA